MRLTFALALSLLAPAAFADSLECVPAEGRTSQGDLGTIAGRAVRYRQCQRTEPEAAGAIWLDWDDPKTGARISQSVAEGPCVDGPPARDGNSLVVEIPDCSRYSEGGTTTVRLRFDAAAGLFVESSRKSRSFMAEALAKVNEAIGRGDLLEASTLLTLLGTNVSGWDDHTRDWLGLLAASAHKQALARYRRGDKLGAASLSAWVFKLPYGVDPCACANFEDAFCVSVDARVFPFKRTPAAAEMVNDLAFFLADASQELPHRKQRRAAGELALEALRSVTAEFPQREVAWLNLADLLWSRGQTAQARDAYERWWELAKARKESMPAHIKERLSEPPAHE